MRAITLLLTASLLLAAFAIAPAQAAAPCDETTVLTSQGSVTLRGDCTVDLRVNMTCAPPSHTTVDRSAGGHHARLSVCNGGLVPPVTIAEPPVALPDAQPGCPPRTVEEETPLGTHRVVQHHNCRVDVTLNEGIVCPGASVGKKEFDVSGSTVTYYHCENPNQGGPSPGDLGLGAGPASPASPVDPAVVDPLGGPCSPYDKAYASYVHVVRNEDCSQGVELRGYIHCIWGTQMNTVGAGPAYVAYETCRQPYETSAAGRDVYVGKTAVTQCNPPAHGYYERVVDTDDVDVYLWRCAIA